jgi:hypothetical protein
VRPWIDTETHRRPGSASSQTFLPIVTTEQSNPGRHFQTDSTKGVINIVTRFLDIPDDPRESLRKHSGEHVNDLRAFMASGKDYVEYDTRGMNKQGIRKKYNGFYQAIRRPEFYGLVMVTRYGEHIRLIRQG